MTEERHVARVDVEGNAEQKLDQIADSSEKAGRELKKTETYTQNISKQFNQMKGAALAAVAAFAAMVAVAAKAVKTFADQEAAQSRLDRSLNRVNATLEERQRLESLMIKNRDRFGTATNEQRDALAKLAEASGSAATAYRDLQLAQDIAAQEGSSVAEASEAIRRARIGEVEELKKYNGFTKESVEELGKLEDQSLKSEIAIGRLENAYKGAAEENRGTNDAIKSFEQQLEDAEADVGSMITDLGLLSAALAEAATGADDGTISFGTLASALGDAADSMGRFRVEMNAYLETASPAEAVGGFVSAVQNPAGYIAQEYGLGLFGQSRRDRGRRQNAKNVARDAARKAASAQAQESAPASFEFGVEDGMILSPDGGTKKPKRKEDVMELTEADMQAYERQLEIEKKKREIAEEDNELRRAELELELRILEIRNQQLDAAIEAERIRAAEADSAREVAEIKQASTDAFIEQQNQELDAVLAKNEAIRNQERKTAEERAEYLAGLKEARDASNQAAIQGIQGVAQAATGFIKNERARAGIRGAMEAAEAIAAGAVGNVGGAVAHGLAAGKFFAIAGGAGGSGGGGGGGATAAAARAARGRSISRDSGPATGGSLGGPGGNTNVTVVYQSTWPPTPQNSRDHANSVASELLNRSTFRGAW